MRSTGEHNRTGAGGHSRLPPTLRASAAVIRDGRILLVRQAKAESTYWLLPGGRVERGETLAETVVRELAEECRLDVDVLQPPLALVESLSPDGGKRRHAVEIVFAAHLTDPGAVPRVGDPAIKEIAWVSADRLAGLQLRPPITDLVTTWLELFRSGLPDPWPPLVSTGVRWIVS